MSTLIVAIIIIASIAGICLLLIWINNKHKRKAMNELLHHFSEAGTKNNLSFSSQELLPDCILGLDGIHRKLLIVNRKSADEVVGHLINLDEVKSCSVKKYYTAIPAGSLKSKRLEQLLESVVLHFELANGKSPMEIAFYKQVDHHIYQLQDLEQKAKDWETILSKMLVTPLRIAR
jgi:hypothetical protein